MKTLQNNSWKNVSEIDLIYKTKIKNSQRPHVTSSQYAYSLIKDCWDPGKIEFLEQFKVLLLNQSNKVLGIYEVSSGGITSTVVDVRLLFAAALKAGAAGLIIAHNHPSGNVLPSEPDKHITKKISMAGEVLDIKLLDHLIVTSEHYYSFADQGAL
ncbi:JAB domain-containing protein [Flavobacterium johnsoniae]|jgi:DNA repair protein RadC|uniref:DNA repair protein RadC n=1 Tax=Flavobacterium johnsoniae (strain ATCC 17061 / DSM 2064 / JCM 8514 / BCRC 14874 / CCUG 350202 / NBRC 14942 / NCIMB 11054 / UW101) TaxID=376686 RepID=A5FDD8_FLAJ1|nr:JAB domain-containing protein [Flavobacterium johnsoniae]ABQ06776.1 DNA repair protein RadC [Flavobacterium johnsoniae UW101]OXE97359.1 DNA repair protein [Flavobacterium johnsoniae UW101]WQG81392.1 JAB domain-containing protein [Flavobacterium johnsoniae UW101]SHL40934.1 DNA repair protein radc [Flavobacterium johnsoniae]